MVDVNQSLFMRALRREAVERTPVWFMRQAGRYLPEYRATRQQAGSFLDLCKNTPLACEVTLQPLRRYALDAAIVFSDILTIPDAMGLGLYFKNGEGPCFKYPLHSTTAIHQLRTPAISESLDYVFSAVAMVRKEMPTHLPLIGFSGSPFTLACYMVEGHSSPDFPRMQALIKEHPASAHHLLNALTTAVVDYLKGQVMAGANALMIFDTWGGLLSTDNYLNFSRNYMRTIVQEVQKTYPHIPIILFTKGARQWLRAIAEAGCQCVGIDAKTPIGWAREQIGDKVALQGNLDPALLLTDKETLKTAIHSILSDFGPHNGHIFNLGHGITPETSPDMIQWVIDEVREASEIIHKKSQAY